MSNDRDGGSFLFSGFVQLQDGVKLGAPLDRLHFNINDIEFFKQRSFNHGLFYFLIVETNLHRLFCDRFNNPQISNLAFGITTGLIPIKDSILLNIGTANSSLGCKEISGSITYRSGLIAINGDRAFYLGPFRRLLPPT